MPGQSEKDVGNDALKNIRRRIRAVEYNKNQFQSSRIDAPAGNQTNIASFEEHTRVPKPFRLQMKSTPVPDGWKEIWSGKMLVGGQQEDAIALRKV